MRKYRLVPYNVPLAEDPPDAPSSTTYSQISLNPKPEILKNSPASIPQESFEGRGSIGTSGKAISPSMEKDILSSADGIQRGKIKLLIDYRQ